MEITDSQRRKAPGKARLGIAARLLLSIVFNCALDPHAIPIQNLYAAFEITVRKALCQVRDHELLLPYPVIIPFEVLVDEKRQEGDAAEKGSREQIVGVGVAH